MSTRCHPDDEQFPGIVALRLDGGLFFATADALGDRIRELSLSNDPPLIAVVLDCADIPFVDSEGSAQLEEIVELAREHGITIRLARVKPAVRDVLARDGVIDAIGADHIHDDVNQAVETQLVTDPQPGGARPHG